MAAVKGWPRHLRHGSVFAAVPKIRNEGAYRVTGEKPDNQAEAGCAKGERNLLVCHGNREVLYALEIPLPPIGIASLREALL